MTAVSAGAVTLVDLEARPDLRDAADALVRGNLPEFMLWASPGNWRWTRVYDQYPAYQVVAIDSNGQVVAAVHAVPVGWNGEHAALPGGYDDVLVQATAATLTRARCTCLLSLSVRGGDRRRGLAEDLLCEVRRRARQRGHLAVIGPLRPTKKSVYPLVSMAAYVAWQDELGRPFDPWLRTHVALGAEVLGIAPRSFVVRERRARWERMTRHAMPSPGDYIVSGALVPVQIDERGVGTYAEPNVWVCHWLRGSEATAD